MAARAEASERLADQIVEGLTSGLVVVDRAGTVQAVNPAAQRILELGEARAGTPFRDAAEPRAPALADLIAEALEVGSPIVRRTITLGGVRGRGTSASRCRRLRRPTARCKRAVCLFTDLTAVVELEEQLRLKEALARLGELTAGLAHEFRNGLATIHGYGRCSIRRRCPTGAHLRRRHSRGNHRARRGRHQLPALCAPGAADDGAGRSARGDRRARSKMCPAPPSAVTLEGNFADDRWRRRAAAAGVQQPVPQQPRGVRGRRHAAARSRARRHHRRAIARWSFEDNGPGFAPEALSKVVPAVRDDESHRHRPRPRDRAESDRVAQRPHYRRQPTRRRRAVPRSLAARRRAS